MFIKAFKIHAIISTMQAFKDGNTRFGRLLQNAKLYSDTNNLLKKSYENPTLYITKAYNPYRSQYRQLIEKIVRDKSLDSLNNWIGFNANRAQDSLYNNNSRVEKIKLK